MQVHVCTYNISNVHNTYLLSWYLIQLSVAKKRKPLCLLGTLHNKLSARGQLMTAAETLNKRPTSFSFHTATEEEVCVKIKITHKSRVKEWNREHKTYTFLLITDLHVYTYLSMSASISVCLVAPSSFLSRWCASVLSAVPCSWTNCDAARAQNQ